MHSDRCSHACIGGQAHAQCALRPHVSHAHADVQPHAVQLPCFTLWLKAGIAFCSQETGPWAATGGNKAPAPAMVMHAPCMVRASNGTTLAESWKFWHVQAGGRRGGPAHLQL
jgi:hypothetical protein